MEVISVTNEVVFIVYSDGSSLARVASGSVGDVFKIVVVSYRVVVGVALLVHRLVGVHAGSVVEHLVGGALGADQRRIVLDAVGDVSELASSAGGVEPVVVGAGVALRVALVLNTIVDGGCFVNAFLQDGDGEVVEGAFQTTVLLGVGVGITVFDWDVLFTGLRLNEVLVVADDAAVSLNLIGQAVRLGS
ncbi:MAG: hypothetical protein GY938_09010 [Ketobacter sp.]|nr:hypothetical protein [Ketobacter sp.]